MHLRKTLFAEVYSVLAQKYRLLTGRQILVLAFWGTLLAALDLFGLALIIQALDPHARFLNFSKQNSSELFLIAVLGLFLLKNIFSVLIQFLITRRLFQITLESVSQKYLQYLKTENAIHKPSSHQALHEVNGLVFSFTEGILLPFIAVLSEALLLTVIVGALLFYRPVSTLMLLLLILPLTALLLYANRKALQKNSQSIASIQGNLYKNTSELIHGHTELLLNGVGMEHYKRFRHWAREHMQLKQEFSIRHGQLPFRILEFSAVMALVILIMSKTLQGSAVIDLAVFGAAAFRLIPAINRIIGSHATMNLHRHLLHFLPLQNQLPGNPSSASAVECHFEQDIHLKQLSFAYPGKELLIDQLDLRISKGRMTGIKGVSGSGKSTLLQMVAGLCLPEKGEILLDGVPLESKHLNSWHRWVAYVPQHLFIAENSVLNNVALCDMYRKPDVERAMWCLDQASLGPWLQSLPLGIDTPLAEGGATLSGGQKQRLVLARALYKGAELFLLDEITNALDDETEKEVIQTLLNLREMGKTLLIVSHKSSLLSVCDEVWNMQEGKLQRFLSIPLS